MRPYREWFPQRGCNSPNAEKDFDTNPRLAKNKFCSSCPVRRDCLNYALLYKEEGIWGGTTTADRDQILRQIPQIRKRLEAEAIQLGILENRYSIEQYWQQIREARKLAGNTRQVVSNARVPAVAAPTLTEFEALLVEWNIQ